MRREIRKEDELREKVILSSRIILKSSKRAIFRVHNNEMMKAEKLIERAGIEIGRIRTLVKSMHELDAIGAYSQAMQEYVEAYSFHAIMKNEGLPSNRLLKASPSDYLMGLCDLTGELSRAAVNIAIKKDIEGVRMIRDLVVRIYGEFLRLDLRNGELRKKSDSIKYNLRRIEDALYELSLRTG